MGMHTFHLEPRDLLFLRDARPMEASYAGLGNNWPRPDQLWNALINFFHRQWPGHQPWEHRHRENESDRNKDSSFRFGALTTAGPFPNVSPQVASVGDDLPPKPGMYLPCPLDLTADSDGRLHPMTLTSAAGMNLPVPLKYSFAATTLGKTEAPRWISTSDYANYLEGKALSASEASLFFPERNIGIAIDPRTHATVEGKLYQAEYLRMREGVSLAFAASCIVTGPSRQETDVFAQPPCDADSFALIVGGQQGIVRIRRTAQPLDLPDSSPAGGDGLVKWVLLTPALYPVIPANPAKGIAAHPGGWLPNWVDPDTGAVMLPRGELPNRADYRTRSEWRKAVANLPRFGATLVAARIGKPVAFSGWDLRTGPKPTQLAVPAGSVYVFKCNDDDEARDLVRTLSWNGGDGREPRNRRSTLLGEKGFGYGVCAPWTISDTPESLRP